MRKKAKTLCVNAILPQELGGDEMLVGGRVFWRVVWGEALKRERNNNNSQLKRGKLSLYIFLIFCVVWRGKRKSSLSKLLIVLLACTKFCLFPKKIKKNKESERDFPIKYEMRLYEFEWEKFMLLKGGLPKYVGICKAIFKRLLLYSSSYSVVWCERDIAKWYPVCVCFCFHHFFSRFDCVCCWWGQWI